MFGMQQLYNIGTLMIVDATDRHRTERARLRMKIRR